MKKRWFWLVTLLLVFSLVLAACGGDETDETAGEEPAADNVDEALEETQADEGVDLQEEDVPEEAEPMQANELVLMGWSSSDAENTRLQSIVDDFNAANEDMNVTLNLVPDYDTKLQTTLAGGAPPDVFYIDSFRLPDLVEAGALEPAEGRLENPDDFYPSLREAFTYNGTFYCPPKDFSTLALEYNVDMFEAAGLELPNADWTWDDLRAAAEALTDEDAGVVGMSITPDFARYIAFLYQAGGEVTNADFTQMQINSPEALDAMEFYVGMVNDGIAAQPSDLDSGWPGEAFGKERAAMVVEGNWVIPFLGDNYPDLNYGVTELPEGPGGHATMAFTVCYGVPANISDERKDAAFELVNYLTGSEGMKAWTDLGLAMPTRASLADGWLEQYPELEPFIAGADYARAWQFAPGFQDFLDTINSGLQQAFTGAALPEGVLEEAADVGQQVLDR